MTERCARHPGARAGWGCRTCGPLCPGCAFVRQVQSVELTCCARCGDRAEPLLAPRSALRPFGSWLPGALAWPLGRAQLVGVAGLAAVLWPLWNFGALAGLLGFLVYWAFLFGVVRRTAAGDDDLGPPDFTDVFADLVMPSVRGAVACAPIWVLALAFVVGAVDALKSGAPIGVVPWLCLAAAVVLGLVYGPAAVLLAATGVGALDLLNPLAAVRLAHRLGRDYALAAGSILALAGLDLALYFPARGITRTGVFFLSGWVGTAVGLLCPLVAARILGLLLHVRGDAVGFGAPGQYLDPVLPGAVPRGAEPALPTVAAE